MKDAGCTSFWEGEGEGALGLLLSYEGCDAGCTLFWEGEGEGEGALGLLLSY